MLRTFAALFAALFAATLLLSGCARPSYINVPNDGGDAAINAPNWQTTVLVQKAALAYLLERSAIPGDIVLQLPEGTSDATAFDIAADLSAYNVYPEGQAPSDEVQIVEVREIMVRAARARVDVIRPGSLAEREFVEVHLDWTVFGGWEAERLQVRNFGVDRVDPSKLAAPGRAPAEPSYEEVAPAEDGTAE